MDEGTAAGAAGGGRARAGDRLAAAAIALTLALVLALRAAFAPPAAQRVDAPAASFSAERALARLARVLGDGAPHPAGSAAHARVRERLLGELRELGLAVQEQRALQRGPDGKVALVHNVLAELPGSQPDDALLLVAHYDSVGASPGAGDDGSGVATLLETARALTADASLARRNPVLFLFSDAEEVGLIGAAAFCAHHPWNERVRVAVNVEARGTHGPSLMFETSSGNARLIGLFADAGRSPRASSLAEWVYKHMPNDTDFSVLRAAGKAGFNFAFIGGLERYHTSGDDLAALDPRSVQHHGDQALALARALCTRDDLALLARTDGPEADYFDLFGRVLVHWPRAWTGIGAWLALAAGGAAALAALATRRVPWRALAAGLVALAAVPAASVAAGGLCFLALARLRDAPDPALAHPGAASVLAHALPLALAALVARTFGGRASSGGRRAALAGVDGVERGAGLWLAALLAAAAGALALARVAQGAGYLLLVPALVALCAALPSLPALVSKPRAAPAHLGPAACALAVLAPLAAMAIVWVPIGSALELDFGARLAPLPFLVPGLIGAAALPALAAARARLLGGVAGAAGLVAALALLLLATRPVHGPDRPAWLNVRYVANADLGSARLEVSTFDRALPPALAERVALTRGREPPFPWLTLDRSLFAAPTEVWDVPPPALEVLEITQQPDGRLLRGRISSPRGASRLHLRLPSGARLVRARSGELEASGFGAQPSTIFCALDPHGVEVLVLLEAPGPARLWLLDQDWSLPSAARELARARPPDCVPRADGDVSILGASFLIE